MSILLQVVDTTMHTAQTAQQTVAKISLWGLLGKGGVLMYPLYFLLILAIFMFFERFIAIRKASRIDANFMHMIRDNILSNNISSAKSLARNTDSPVARIIEKGLRRVGKPIDVIEKSMESVGRLELYKMEKNLNILSLIAGIAPMFGFLGTIVGMIELFFEITSTHTFELDTIAGGIYVKMITSGTGLIIGLIAYIMHNYLTTQVDKTANEMEVASTEFIDILQEPTK
ncbi:MotA/TolQ/ExbB proton channel family protein [Arachidicoccus soli]|uniref:MotA/TolQ/ExbB proton channel family protein n=1 Tax=Arachidicoccus soli TaxID=2341117 RepID=A0A386HS89_9BACT|nr:MotA/TolQ/ExbB proton channel family protein [Arachidicoccus soli]AYD48509.1 MotA/TolQ/ExbB proton channel family protein [Arachidicoccus soli]